jgi:hypothetical protein
MNKQEQELEQLVKEVESVNITVPPLFELFATMFSILVAIMLFAYPNMIYTYPARLYDNMMTIMPQSWWAISFFGASMLKAAGLLIGKNVLRIVGLLASVALYITLAICYALDFPSIGSITFSCMAIFTIISIPFVKHTSIKYKGE